MGRLTKDHQHRLGVFVEKLEKRLQAVGRPFIPEVQDYSLEFLQTFVEEVEAGKYQGGSFLKNSAPHIWKAISEMIVINFPEFHRPITEEDRAKDVRLDKRFTKARFFWDPTYVYDFGVRYDWRHKTAETEIFRKFQDWRLEADNRSSNEARDRRSFKFEWGDTEYDRLYDLALRCLRERNAVQTDTERCVRLIFGLSFFTGRRPWEEVGRISVFRESDPPDDNPDVEHADDWLEVEGIGKKKDEKEASVIIPVFGISSRELVEALVELRMIESGKTWFSLTRDKGSTASSQIIGALGYQWRKFSDSEVEPCFERSLAAGYNFDHNASKNSGVAQFNAYDLRRLYVSFAFHRYCEFCRDNGIRVPEDPIDYAAMILGHSTEGVSEQHTITYTLFRYRGGEELNPAGVTNERFTKRQLAPC
jgi:hypothetical protein